MITPCTEEKALIAAAKRGDKAAFGILVKAYQRQAYGAAFSFVGNRDDALDLAQDAFVRAYRAIKRFDTSLPFYPWYHRILRNVCLNYLRRRNRRKETSLDHLMTVGFDAEHNGLLPDDKAHLRDLKREIKQGMAQLSPEHREVIYLRHFQDLSYSEIAQCLDIPPGTVMSRLHGARKNLKKCLTAQQAELVST